jgi:hypothetical protein
MHKYFSPPQKLGITFLLKLITQAGTAVQKTITLKIKFCSMQFKFGTRYETIIHREIKSVIRI